MLGRETNAITRSADLHTAVRFVGAITRGPGATGNDSRWRRNVEEWRKGLRGDFLARLHYDKYYDFMSYRDFPPIEA